MLFVRDCATSKYLDSFAVGTGVIERNFVPPINDLESTCEVLWLALLRHRGRRRLFIRECSRDPDEPTKIDDSSFTGTAAGTITLEDDIAAE
jgi:hypothetical protein